MAEPPGSSAVVKGFNYCIFAVRGLQMLPPGGIKTRGGPYDTYTQIRSPESSSVLMDPRETPTEHQARQHGAARVSKGDWHHVLTP